MSLFWTSGYVNLTLSGSTGILPPEKFSQLKISGSQRAILIFNLDDTGGFVPELAKTASLVKPPLIPQNKTDAELLLLTGSYNGEIIYNTTTDNLVYWQKNKWKAI